ncbi:hypothetical protein AN958_04046 [Leucoagaricus sp. SymC.cos]|nr:hypothetical protein AN958_04046 [Leucoagaricus sp. SymC.cos]
MSSKANETLDQTTAAQDLAIALNDGLNLIQTDLKANQQQNDLKSVLESRLSHYYFSRNQDWPSGSLKSLRDTELMTAREALYVIERIQELLSIEDDAIVPTIGTRDLGQIRTLLSLVFKWGPIPAASSSSKVVDLSTVVDDYSLLSEITLRILGLIFPSGVHGKLAQSLITTTLLNRHFVDILRPALSLGWLPKSLNTEGMPVVDSIRPLIMRLLSTVSTSQTIAALGSILSDSSSQPTHVHRACSALLSRQLLRSDGVRGLFGAVFGEEESSGGDIVVEKLEHVSTLLNAVPAITKPHDYFAHVIPRIIAHLSEKSPSAYRRAAAFTISRMFRDDESPVLRSVKRSIIFNFLHDPFHHVNELDGYSLQQLERLPSATKVYLRPDVAIDALLTLFSNADPSPSFISELLSPIVPSLYSLLYHLVKFKTSDPRLKESIHGMLLAWGKIVTRDEGLDTLWSITKKGQERGWKVDLEGHIQLQLEMEQLTSLSLLTPAQVPDTVDLEDLEFDANIFNLYPDPLHLVKLIKDMDRGDIASALFVRLLEAYRQEKAQSGGDTLRILLNLQIIMQMQKQLSEGTTSNILKMPQQLLSFIYHVLESANSAPPEGRRLETSELEERLKIVSLEPQGEDQLEYAADSDDDMPDSEVNRPDDDLIETSLNLLLSVLEADEDLSARIMPILNDIFSLLEPLSRDGSSSIRPLAREARLVMTARLASTSQPRQGKRRTEVEESAQEIYQKALKLLQDPILPVRAHGLLLLRQLVTPGGKARALDLALTPAVLSIFLQSVQDEDSYIFLNSVQGLAAMVDGLGSDVLKGLIQEYAGKLDGLGLSAITRQEVDKRTRVGEALGIVIKKCGQALGIYADLLVPPLFKLLRAPEIPSTLRTSAVSLLADCVNTYSLAILSYVEDLTGALLDLLQTETVPVQQHASRHGSDAEHDTQEKKIEDGEKGNNEVAEDRPEKVPETMDNAPTSRNTKLPPLRRAALHFLGLLVRSATQHTYESPSHGNSFLSQAMIHRATITLGYISATDEDNVVRVMAREAREGLGGLQKAKLGL